MKILADENMPYAQELFSALGDLTLVSGRKIAAELLAEAEVLLVRSVTKVDRQLLDLAPKLRFVGSATIGTDHVDQQLIHERGITFVNAPGCNRVSVAEYVLSALLVYAQTSGQSLAGKTLGIIGLGNTGSAVAAVAQALGMELLCCDPPRQRRGDAGAWVDLERALNADIVSFHVPLLRQGEDATHHLLNAERIAKLRPEQLLINACRGEVWDNQALLARQRGAAPLTLIMDVWEGEPNPLIELVPHTLIATPHIAGYSLEGRTNGSDMIYRALCDFLGVRAEQSLEDYLPAAAISRVTVNESYSESLAARLVHLVYDVRRDDCRFRQQLGIAGSFDAQRKHYPERRQLATLHIEGDPDPHWQALGFAVG